ncbi:MAG TPA: hypothetical protein VJ742_01155, partial [Nitrososphaera sp.]|nr:hypothetical protein [Nitrososphaera sp.]
MDTEKLGQQFVRAKKFGVPIIGVETPDMQATIDNCIKALTNGTTYPMLCWDVVNGLRWLNKEGQTAVEKVYQAGQL